MKPIVLQTGRSYTKAQRAERERLENDYRVSRAGLVPPEELSPRAKRKFEEIASAAFWLDELSTDLLAAYCVAWDKYLLVVEAMEGTDEVLMYVNNKNETITRQNPLRRPLIQYVEQMSLLSSKLGLSNIDRLRLTIPEVTKKASENPFSEFMGA